MNRFAHVRNAALVAAFCGGTVLAQAAEPAAPAPAAQQQAQQEQQLAQKQQQLEQQLESARQRLETAAREVGELSEQLGRQTSDRMIERFGGPPARAILGVQVQRSSAGGAQVVAVSPGGPAEVAGIKDDDVITAIGGVDLAGADPSRALVERMRELPPGQKVKVSALRGGKKMDFEVTPRSAPAMAWRGMPGMPGMGGVAGPFGPEFRPGPQQRIELRQFEQDNAETFRGMEFATLSDRLGSYFGVKSGVLVVRAGDGGTFKLQDGDVIVSIDGREPTSAAHATRILRSYQPGEKISLRVQRDRKAQNIEVALPDRGPGRRPDRD